MLPVIPIIPSSQITVGVPSKIVTGPPVLRLTTSFSVPGSLPWQVFNTDPTVAISAPLIFVRIGASAIPSTDCATTGYGIGSGLGAVGVVHTLTASGVTECPLFSVITAISSAVTLLISTRSRWNVKISSANRTASDRP
jgi:hypothetical protein